MQTPETAAAYVISQSVAALIEAMGMHAENQHRLSLNESVAYGEEAFNSLIEASGIYHNNVVTILNGATSRT